MTSRPKVGLLPLYVSLYDKVRPEARGAFQPFLAKVSDGFAGRGIDVLKSDICCVRNEFAQTVEMFEREHVDIIVTLHLAYSPSGEAIDVLRRTKLPVLILDTTTDYAFGHDVDPARLMYNHGIHGVQDLASMLRRHGRPFHIVAGHVTESDVMTRAADIVRAAFAANELRRTKALRIGTSFEGMGDFAVEADLLSGALGVRVDQISPAELAEDAEVVTGKQIEAEIAADRDRYDVRTNPEVHRRSVRLGLGLRARLEAGGYGAFSVNFLAFDSPAPPVETVPFLEACKAMARGVGYAGEGDVLTASLVGALSRAFGQTTFTEIFCPDWKGNALFLSHMGEINPEVAAARPVLLEKPFPYTEALNPAYLACALQSGPAVLVNLAPAADGAFRLIVAPVQMLDDSPAEAMQPMIRGWLRPNQSVAQFLEAYSRCGGTHHSALVYSRKAEALRAFSEFAGMECCCL